MTARPATSIQELLPKLRCPDSGAELILREGAIEVDGISGVRYPLTQGVPDLRRPPKRLVIDRPWYEPWADLDDVEIAFPPAESSSDLPMHLDRYLASVAKGPGEGRWILEVGCGERQCEAWFTRRGFRYVGSDVDIRGPGPNILADAHNLPIKDQAFDYYLSLAVYEHLVSPLSAALEAFRILRPGGVFFGSAAFVYGFHDRASFHHMSHGGLLYVLRAAGFEVKSMWPDWSYTSSIAEMGFRGGQGAPWRLATRAFLSTMEWTYLRTSNTIRRVLGKRRIDEMQRRIHQAGSVSFCARRPVNS